MNRIVKYLFITDYTTSRGDFHQCFEVSYVLPDGESLEKAKVICIEHIKRQIRSRGYLLTRLQIAYSDLNVFELQDLIDGKLPANSQGKVIILELEEVDI